MNRFTPGNRVTLLRDGAEYFPALVQAFEAAEHEVWLESYIFADDATGRLVAAALARAAQRGVRVRVLVDGWGAKLYLSTALERDMLDDMPEICAGAESLHKATRTPQPAVVLVTARK